MTQQKLTWVVTLTLVEMTAGSLIHVTKELQELEDSYGDCKSLKAYQEEENELIEKQLSEQNWNGKGGKN